jgi:putative membrane protein
MNGFEMGGGWFGMGFWWILVIVAVGVVVALAARRGERAPGGESALDVLKRRYARGEVNREEFEQMKRDLGA